MIAYFNTAIDTISGAQSKVLSTVVTDEAIRKPLQSFVDAGAEFVKATAKSTVEFVEQAQKFAETKISKK